MAQAIKSSQIIAHQDKVAKAKGKKEKKGQAASICSGIAGKTFDQLTGVEKDDLLKCIALELGMIEPDP